MRDPYLPNLMPLDDCQSVVVVVEMTEQQQTVNPLDMDRQVAGLEIARQIVELFPAFPFTNNPIWRREGEL